MYIFYLTVFVGQESRGGLSGFSASGSLTGLQTGCQLGLRYLLKSRLGKDTPPYSLTCCWQDSVLQGLLD